MEIIRRNVATVQQVSPRARAEGSAQKEFSSLSAHKPISLPIWCEPNLSSMKQLFQLSPAKWLLLLIPKAMSLRLPFFPQERWPVDEFLKMSLRHQSQRLWPLLKYHKSTDKEVFEILQTFTKQYCLPGLVSEKEWQSQYRISPAWRSWKMKTCTKLQANTYSLAIESQFF